MVSFLDDSDFPSLPADMPINHPHIIDIASFDSVQEVHEYEESRLTGLTLWDAVVTLLHTKAPAHLHDLLDLDREEVKIVVGDERRADKIVIWRRREHVLVSWLDTRRTIPRSKTNDTKQVGGFVNHLEYGLYEWDNVVRCSISTTGAWKFTHASYGLCAEPDWSAVWDAGFTDAPCYQQVGVYVNATERSHIALTLSQLIMESCPWSEAKFDWVP